MTIEHTACTRCVMDTTDPSITFDNNGVCSHCRNFDDVTSKAWFPNEEGRVRLEAQLDEIREQGKGKDYDCILGLSGGVDSSYMALKAHEWGLRPLVMHVDAGWNSELAVANIEKIVKHCDYDLHTHVVDWEEMRDLQLSFLRAAIPNQDVPQDHIFFASMYHFATKNDIRYILSGGNIATECIFPHSWHGSAMDATSLKAIHKKYGKRKLRHYKTIGFVDYYFWYPFVKGMRTVRPLNFMPYDKDKAIEELKKIGWRSYGRKHGESIFTKFFQNYYLPKKFGYDKRKPHLSSMIVTGHMTREEALEKLAEPLYDEKELRRDIEYLCKKLRLTEEQFLEIMDAEPHTHEDFPNWLGKQRLAKAGQRFVARLTGKNIKVYS